MDRLPTGPETDRFREDVVRLAGEAPGRLGLAVSGGADSLALLLLAQAAFPGLIRVATVDHRLRPEAAAEAEYVAGICARLGVAHDVLRPATPIVGNIQSGAREARYALLGQWRLSQHMDWIATGHHLDDQAETLLMRLNRGSGLAGLASIRPVHGQLIRPVLGWRRSELEAVVASAGIQPVDDPSNRDERFDRTRFRERLKAVEWLDPRGLSRSAGALAEAEAAMEWVADQLWAERWSEESGRFSLAVDGLPPELRRRLVLRALRRLVPTAQPRGDELGRAISALEAGQCITLSGVKAWTEGRWCFALAPPRRADGQ